jgi:two-component system chemotaxis response regulator CheB
VAASSVEVRSLVKEALHAGCGAAPPKIAANGQLALQMLTHGSVDVLITESHLPDMQDNEIVEQVIGRGFENHIVVLASNPMAAAKSAKDFLKHGRVHFVETPSEQQFKRFTADLRRIFDKISQLPGKLPRASESRPVDTPKQILKDPNKAPALSQAVVNQAVGSGKFQKLTLDSFKAKVVCIGSSTGGPAALEAVVSKLRGKSHLPILIVQHMPAGFTESLAARLQAVSGLPSAEARPGESLKAGRIYIAPGDYHLRLSEADGDITLALDHGPKRNSVRPCVDLLFETAAGIFGRNTLGMVLTGMGEDGAIGALAIKKVGGAVVIQDQESSVVWGMPGAIFQGGWFDVMGNLERCSDILTMICQKT